MSDTGTTMYQAIEQIRGLFAEMAGLLATSAALLERRGWISCGTTATCDSSASINLPSRWAPCYVFRFLRRTDGAGAPQLIAVAIYLCNPGEGRRLTEPLIVGLAFDIGSEDPQLQRWNWNYAALPLRVSDLAFDGTVMELKAPDKLLEKTVITRMCAFARPLATVNNSEQLHQLVIEPLCAVVDRFGEAVADR